jgi:hypothetical protein
MLSSQLCWLKALSRRSGRSAAFQFSIATFHLSAAVRHLPTDEQEAFSKRYQALMRHYGMQPTWNNAGIAHENGDVEQSHFRFKEALDQGLRVLCWLRGISVLKRALMWALPVLFLCSLLIREMT